MAEIISLRRAKAGKPKARLVSLQTVRLPREPKNLLGITCIAEDFDDPMPDLEDAFEGKGRNFSGGSPPPKPSPIKGEG
ncbi:MAG TPA: hypothetical protein VJ770_21630 [Stellaceae bacterium]|nr:hypothetical protein [Stellaceae bacterium]